MPRARHLSSTLRARITGRPVSITYNSVPAAPSTLRIGGKSCGSGDSVAFVSKTPGYPSAQATVSDPDGTEWNLTVQFFIAKAGTPTPSTPTLSKAATLAFGRTGEAKGDVAVELWKIRTASAKVRVTTFIGDEMIVVRNSQRVLRLPPDESAYLRDYLYVDGATKNVCYRVDVTPGTRDASARPYEGEWKVSSAEALPAGVWISVAGVFDAMRQEATVNVNGAGTTSSVVGDPTDSSWDLDVSETNVAHGTLNGAVDDVRV